MKYSCRRAFVNIGDVCKNGNGLNKEHICIRSEKCVSLPRDIKNKNYPDICSFDGHKPIVCCSPTNSNDQQPDIHLSKYQNTNVIRESTFEMQYYKLCIFMLY